MFIVIEIIFILLIQYNLKMKKQDKQIEGQQMFEYNQNAPDIGTQILDNALPSNINFDDISQDKKLNQKEYQGTNIPQHAQYIKKKQPSPEDSIKIYTIKTIKGKTQINEQPKYQEGSIIKDGSLQTYDVRGLSQQKNSGIKFIWQTIVGYVKREICIVQGYFYILERVKEGYFVHQSFKLSEIFKIFLDSEENKVRVIFKTQSDKTKLITKDFQVNNTEDIMHLFNEETGKVGLMTISSE